VSTSLCPVSAPVAAPIADALAHFQHVHLELKLKRATDRLAAAMKAGDELEIVDASDVLHRVWAELMPRRQTQFDRRKGDQVTA
jgi:hypothetical protein